MTSPLPLSRIEREDLVFTFSPLRYATAVGFAPYAWQKEVVTSSARHIAINGARRGGKSFLIGFIPTHKARFFPGSVTLITAPTEAQAVEDMRIIRAYIATDPSYPGILRASDRQLELANGSRIIVIPSTETAARGYPNPDLIIPDEAAFIPDEIFKDCLIPMLNGNPRCRLLVISSPHGRSGNPGRYFFNTMRNKAYERFEVRAPFEIDPDDPTNLLPAEPEEAYKARKARDGIRAYYSPRHSSREEQLFILGEQGSLSYAQNQLAEFVEPEDQVFSYEEIDRIFRPGAAPLAGGLAPAPLKAMEFPTLE